MSATAAPTITNRYDFVYFFDVTDGNPNGDPDAGNLPRIDPETGQGLVTDVCLKRKIRNYVAIEKSNDTRYQIFVRDRAVLNEAIERPYFESNRVRECVTAWEAWRKNKKKNPRPERHQDDIAAEWMCDNFFDIRTFGAVLTTGDEKTIDIDGVKAKIRMTAGQVRGPIQFGFARSIDPVVTLEHSITRCAVTNEKDLDKKRTMGRKFTIPYGLYRVHGYVSPHMADPKRHGTGFNEDDLSLVKRALNMMFEVDHSAARGQMAPRECFAFKHESALGNARSDKLFSLVGFRLKDQNKPPRCFDDYELIDNTGKLPSGVTVERWIE